VTDAHRGSCFCGAVEFEARGAPLDMGYCHCDSCRAWSGAPVTAFTLWSAEAVSVTTGAGHLGAINRTGFSNRRFCRECGGHVLIEHPGLGFIDVPAGKLPTLSFVPTVHLNYAETRLPMKDGLPKLRDFPAEAGGSRELLAE
jgi:hypothetical protein